MLDSGISSPRPVRTVKSHVHSAENRGGVARYAFQKRVFDLALSIPLVVAFVIFAGVLLVLNPFFNRGGLFYVQKRMGVDCLPFRVVKFRSMVAADDTDRGAFDPLNADRITPLGQIIRKSRIDELPQVLNVLTGEMSLIGPRPDAYDHAVIYAETIPGYKERCKIKPGISGYAQIKIGYVDGRDGVVKKVRADHVYIRNASFKFDLWIAWRTLFTVLGRQGA